jgi:hypothetical protein
MSRFYRIQIGGIFLTEDGTAAGTPCKLSVESVEDLLTTVAGSVAPSANGTPIFQLVEWTKGKQFAIQITTLTKDVWLDLVELLLEALEENQTLTVTGSGDIGDFTVTAKPFPVKPYQATGFINGRILGVTLRFITV